MDWVRLFQGDIGILIQDQFSDSNGYNERMNLTLTELLKLYSTCKELYQSEARLRLVRKLDPKSIHPVYTKSCGLQKVILSDCNDIETLSEYAGEIKDTVIQFTCNSIDTPMKRLQKLFSRLKKLQRVHLVNDDGIDLIPFNIRSQIIHLKCTLAEAPRRLMDLNLDIAHVFHVSFPLNGGNIRNILIDISGFSNLKSLSYISSDANYNKRYVVDCSILPRTIEYLELESINVIGLFNLPHLKTLKLVTFTTIVVFDELQASRRLLPQDRESLLSISNCQNLEILELDVDTRPDTFTAIFKNGFPKLVEMKLANGQKETDFGGFFDNISGLTGIGSFGLCLDNIGTFPSLRCAAFGKMQDDSLPRFFARHPNLIQVTCKEIDWEEPYYEQTPQIRHIHLTGYSRSFYPSFRNRPAQQPRGFPSSLNSLTISAFYEQELCNRLEFPTFLSILDLSDCRIHGISILAYLPNLKELYLQKNQISSITPLLGLQKLKKLDVSSNQLTINEYFELPPNLEQVNLFNNHTSSFLFLKKLKMDMLLCIGKDKKFERVSLLIQDTLCFDEFELDSIILGF